MTNGRLGQYENLKELKWRIETPYGVFVTNPNPMGCFCILAYNLN